MSPNGLRFAVWIVAGFFAVQDVGAHACPFIPEQFVATADGARGPQAAHSPLRIDGLGPTARSTANIPAPLGPAHRKRSIPSLEVELAIFRGGGI